MRVDELQRHRPTSSLSNPGKLLEQLLVTNNPDPDHLRASRSNSLNASLPTVIFSSVLVGADRDSFD
jgi:hypothetical protein